jgi:hypothetical protein
MHTIPCLDALFTLEPYFPPVFRPSSIGSPNNTAVNTQLPLASIGQTKESNISQDHEKIRAWNQNLPEVINACAHDLVAAQAKHQPDLPAIYALGTAISHTPSLISFLHVWRIIFQLEELDQKLLFRSALRNRYGQLYPCWRC